MVLESYFRRRKFGGCKVGRDPRLTKRMIERTNEIELFDNPKSRHADENLDHRNQTLSALRFGRTD